MKKITEITTEREFVSKLRTYYRKARRKGYQRNEISFLGLMEYTGSATREFEYQSDKYFSVGIRAYDWQYGNSLLSALIDKWENEIEAEKRKKQPTTPTETPQISTETAETTELSAEAEEAPKYSISERDGNVYVTFKRGVIRQCAKRCGVSCKSAEWNTIAQAYNGTHSDMGMGLSFFFDGREDAVRFAELVCNGDISGYYKLYMDKIIAEGEARKKRIAEKCAEYDAAQAYFAECMADEDAETVNVSVEAENAAETKENCHSDTRIVSDGYGTQYEVTRHWKNGRVESLDVIVLDTQPQTAKEPPQSPETPQTVECTTDTPKPRETARKPQNRGIGNTRHSRLGANGYAMLDNASATLTAMYVPRECSTADAAYW